MLWSAAELSWGTIATQWDAAFILDSVAVDDSCALAVSTTALQLPAMVLCEDQNSVVMLGSFDDTAEIVAADAISFNFTAAPALTETVLAAANDALVSLALVGVSESTAVNDAHSYVIAASPSIAEPLVLAAAETVSAKMLTGLNAWAGANNSWLDRTHAWDVYLSSIAEDTQAHDSVGDLTETTDYLLESWQLLDSVSVNCVAAAWSAEEVFADFSGLISTSITFTLSEVCGVLGEFHDKSPRRKYEYDPRADSVWRYYDRWSSSWYSSR